LVKERGPPICLVWVVSEPSLAYLSPRRRVAVGSGSERRATVTEPVWSASALATDVAAERCIPGLFGSLNFHQHTCRRRGRGLGRRRKIECEWRALPGHPHLIRLDAGKTSWPWTSAARPLQSLLGCPPGVSRGQRFTIDLLRTGGHPAVVGVHRTMVPQEPSRRVDRIRHWHPVPWAAPPLETQPHRLGGP
jgi:hypothetical protein